MHAHGFVSLLISSSLCSEPGVGSHVSGTVLGPRGAGINKIPFLLSWGPQSAGGSTCEWAVPV